MNNKIIFLDIDGVICNSKQWAQIIEFKGESIYPFDAESIACLNEITNKTGANFVITSTWRKTDRWNILPAYFLNQGITGKIIDRTLKIGDVQRGEEIKEWLSRNPNVTQFVVLDDDDDMDVVKDNFVETNIMVNGELEEGLRRVHIDKVIKILEG